MAKKTSKAKAKDPKKATTAMAWEVYARKKGLDVYLGLFTNKDEAIKHAERKGHHRVSLTFVERKATEVQSGNDSASTHADVD
jgi:hypothetical protein